MTEKKTGARFSIYVRPEQLKWLDRESEKAGMSRSRFIESKVFPEELRVLLTRNGAKRRGQAE